MPDQDAFAFSHADKGMTRFPPNVEQISVEHESLRTWLIVRRNDVKLRFPLCEADAVIWLRFSLVLIPRKAQLQRIMNDLFLSIPSPLALVFRLGALPIG